MWKLFPPLCVSFRFSGFFGRFGQCFCGLAFLQLPFGEWAFLPLVFGEPAFPPPTFGNSVFFGLEVGLDSFPAAKVWLLLPPPSVVSRTFSQPLLHETDVGVLRVLSGRVISRPFPKKIDGTGRPANGCGTI